MKMKRIMSSEEHSTTQHPAGWVLYDGACGLCRRWIPFWRTTLERNGFGIAPLQSDWVIAKLQLEGAELRAQLRLLRADGSQLLGADVYRCIMQRIWWAWPLYLFAITPGFRNLFDWSYRKLAANRYRFSTTCSLD
jgi:predicted DCC family thiol-disulfide oxidoreductase YuxK